jgi:hypothetical protein
MSRQIGVALGVAFLVAVLGTPSPADAVDRFASGWTVMAVASALAACAFAAIGRTGGAPAAAPVARTA